MDKINELCAGIDVGKRFLLCCALTGAAAEEPRSQTRRFDATVQDLVHLRDWLSSENITHVVMESTGSYWVPISNILEGHFTIVLANPEEVKNRKGHKTDRKDAEHLADLLRHDHIRASYIPPKPIRDLRDLTRRRLQLAPRRGPKRAIVAIAHQMLTVLYFVLKNRIPFRGSETVPQKHRRLRRAHHHLRCLRRLGITVQVCGSLEDAPLTG